MIDKYLKANPLPWLTDGENPAVAFHAKNEFTESVDLNKNYKELEESKLTVYFNNNQSGGVLGNFKHPDIFYRGTVWYFLFAAECGYTVHTDFMNKTSEFLIQKTQLPSGGFSFTWNPPAAVGCRTGNLIRAMIMSGAGGDSVLSGTDWIVKNQRHDGGWLHCPVAGLCDIMKMVLLNKPGKGLLRENDELQPSCPVATLACASALQLLNKPEFNAAVSSGAEFLLSNNLFMNRKFNDSVKCGQTGDFAQTGYPVMAQYELISVLGFIFKTGKWNDGRAGEAFNHILKKQNSEGKWSLENRSAGMVKDEGPGSRWVTLNSLRMLQSLYRKENQLENA